MSGTTATREAVTRVLEKLPDARPCGSNKWSARCPAHLKDLTSLKLLALEATQVTDAGLEHLKGLSGLEVLELAGSQVTDAGVEALRKALPQRAIYR